MKKQIFILITMMLAWVGITSATTYTEAPKKEAEIVFADKHHDFGTIKEADGSVTCEFTFKNTGKAPLVIISANAGCGCTQPVFSEDPVAPGASSAIKVTYNPKGRPGEFNKNITVRTNDPKHKKVILKISGSVLPK